MGLETISYRALQVWNLVPTEINDALTLSTLTEKIKSIVNVGYAEHTLQTSKFGS